MQVSAQESAGESAALPFLNQIRSVVSAGSAGVIMKPDAYAHFGNVADAVSGEKKMSAGVSYGLWQPDVTHANIFSVSASYKLNDRMAVTAGASTSLYKEDGKYDELGIKTAEMHPVDVLAGAGFAYKIIDGLLRRCSIELCHVEEHCRYGECFRGGCAGGFPQKRSGPFGGRVQPGNAGEG